MIAPWSLICLTKKQKLETEAKELSAEMLGRTVVSIENEMDVVTDERVSKIKKVECNA